MASYQLLRSNKKSGPYSLQDLVNFGLKAYDLVWVEGKSAAWRYPSEVEELRPYAPQVEEQPYDRFYKKKTQEVKEEPVLVEEKPVMVRQIPVLVKETPVVVMEKKVVVEDKPVVEEKPVPVIEQKPLVEQPSFIEEKYEKYIPKKSVAVTMPAYKSVAVQKPVEPATPVIPAPTITVKENPEAQIKYSQPLDEIKEMYVKTLQERKTKIARKSVALTNLKRAAVIAGLVALGVVTGLVINRGSGSKAVLSQQTTRLSGPSTESVANDATPVDAPINQQAVKDETTLPVDPPASKIIHQAESVSQEKSLPPQIEERLLRLENDQVQQPATRKETVAKPPVSKEVYEDRPVETDTRTGERNRAVRNGSDIPEEKPTAKAVLKPKKGGLESLVSVSSNDYKRVAFGGIRNLELTVANDSRFILDKVTVELQYLKPSEEPLKTEMIQFHNVSPNGTMTMRIRDTNRGIKVSYRIIDIQQSQPETALSGF